MTRRRIYGIVVVLYLLAAGGGVVYRNHVDIASSPAALAAPNITDKCAGLNVETTNQYECYKNEIDSIVKSQSPEAASAFVKQQYQSVAYVKSECHQLMHVVGRAAYAKYGSLAEAFAHGDQFCWSGFYHGIMEQIAAEKGYDYILKNANTICNPVAKQYGNESFNDYNCVHGMGHGFMEALDDNLFKALAACDAFDGQWNQTSCYGGVFMQNIMNVQGPDYTSSTDYPYLKASQPMYPCTAVGERYKQQCYLMQTSYALQVDNYNFSKVFSQCSQIETQYVDTCYQSLGRDASGQSISDVQKTKSTCELGADLDAQTNCIIGAAKDFVSYFHDDVQAYNLCRAMPDPINDTCNQTVSAYYSTF